MSLTERILNRREHRKRQTRQLILDAGCDTFAELGFEACTVRDIIRRTGLASGTFYNYFDTKDEVLREIIDDEIGRISERMRESRQRAKNLHAFVLSAYREIYRAVVTQPKVYRIILRNESVVRELYGDSGFSSAIAILREDMRNAVSGGILPSMNVDWLASVFFGAGYEMARSLLETEAGRIEADEAAEFTARLFLGGIQAFSESDTRPVKLRVRAPKKE
ncbi:TetR/AcrR family transcriptional regulator [Algiphilus sp.]|uniref:TetR/AcrR family transcriptional regulator n=1 Tax=Algiphilus sp. TaxID=1872431 RepID=UPI001CA79B54|nr:TetR/AcrR family transcriptional regulator [Algiphilus sp.]MBY8966741.1 TetR/AcrR family transcriptional regulator [Algiphilus acroporae]MCI5061831.1 TetR/AcrR family transcriptional regulator [Algiphilus sp.]MCI5102464.1 TetR/AcrR family transcriptional regulator [Algiphilus sp.]MCR9091733.1 TetR/AcrR family transcriptional regulator [Pseudomonadota bacterium]